MTDCRKEIEKLLGENLVSWYVNEDGAMKAHYKVTPENLADFIDSFFERRKHKKPFSRVLEDSR